MGKAKAGPAAVVIGVVVLAVIIFVIYHFTLGQSGPKPDVNTIPGYARAKMSPDELARLGISKTAPAGNDASAVAAANPAARGQRR